MGKTIIKIVVTGGPCAGKTTGICKVPGVLAKLGWKTILVPEAATETILAGITPKDMNSKFFQTGIIKSQLAKEKIFEFYANQLDADKVLLICDRGIMDNKAYCSEEAFNYAMKKARLDPVTARDSYVAVLHMVTAADGAEEFYTCKNNEARTEDLEKARILDKKLKEAWSGHPHLRIIDNSSASFDAKIKKLIDEICAVLGEPTPTEIERSFLIKKPTPEILAELKAVPISIFQTYLKSEDGIERRVRQRGANGNYLYFYTEKTGKNKLERIETERRITQKEYLDLLTQADTSLKPIFKQRYCFVWNSTYYECDIYPNWDDKAIIEVEMTTKEQEVILPEVFEVIEEVTTNDKYRNYSIAKGLV